MTHITLCSEKRWSVIRRPYVYFSAYCEDTTSSAKPARMVMETSMYNDDSYNGFRKEDLAQAKRKLKLDLNFSGSGAAKRQRPTSLNPLLTSPDLNMLKLASPELDQLVLQHVGAQHMFPRATNEQEEFAKGFEDTLEQMHSQNSTSSTTSNSSANTTIPPTQFTQLHPPSHLVGNFSIKEEPQTVPSGSPPLSPINMENQERIKLERKRLRNRIAASKCRKRKLERIGRLEDKVNSLKGENTDLQAVVNKLRDQVCALKKEVMEHVSSGCQIPFFTNT